MKILIEYGAKYHILYDELRGLLFTAIQVGDEEILRLLLGQDMDINARDDNGRSLLYEASLFNQSEIVKTLLEKGAVPLSVEEEDLIREFRPLLSP